jgi:hypothetical protein
MADKTANVTRMARDPQRRFAVATAIGTARTVRKPPNDSPCRTSKPARSWYSSAARSGTCAKASPRAVRFVTTVASSHATLATKRTLRLT